MRSTAGAREVAAGGSKATGAVQSGAAISEETAAQGLGRAARELE